MKQRTKLSLCLHGELYVVDLNDVMCFEADDHYTHVYSSNGNNFMVPFCLARIEEKIRDRHCAYKNLVRLGRKYIINIGNIFHVNAVRQFVLLADSHGKVMNISLSKAVLRTLMNSIKADESIADDEMYDGNDA